MLATPGNLFSALGWIYELKHDGFRCLVKKHGDSRPAGARQIARTDRYRQSRKDRKKVEILFAHLKRILKLDKLRLRGFSGARDEVLLAATAQNLRRTAKWLPPIAA